MDYRDYRILSVFDDDGGGFTTGEIVRLTGSQPSRKASALMYRRLYVLNARGFVAMMDEEKPIAWAITPTGRVVLEGFATDRRETAQGSGVEHRPFCQQQRRLT